MTMLTDQEVSEYRTQCSKCHHKTWLWICPNCGHDDREEFNKKLEEDFSETRKDE